MAGYDAIILGAGFSGLAAGIRLAHFGRRVCLLERHARAGGLGSWYARDGREISVGLHALTNCGAEGGRDPALGSLLRQLRLRPADLDLVPQTTSRIAFPDRSLRFANDPAVLAAEVEREFPGRSAAFARLAETVRDTRETDLDAPVWSPARARIREMLGDPGLADMLLCPLFFYGNAAEDDMDWTQLCLLWKAVYTGGFGMPRRGMRPVIERLLARFAECGGEIRTRAEVERLEEENGRIVAARLVGGERLEAERFFSSAGLVETARLAGGVAPGRTGRISLVEVLVETDRDPRALGFADTVTFFSLRPEFRYRRPAGLVEAESGVICVPANYRHDPPSSDRLVRFSALANYPAWREILGTHDSLRAAPAARNRYEAAKREVADALLEAAARLGCDARGHARVLDVFTPLTLERYTAHAEGALYGSPDKHRRGETAWPNLHLIGADQGYLGIVGAMLSGISMANLHALKA